MTKILDVLKANPQKFLQSFPIKIGTSGASGVSHNVQYGQKHMHGNPSKVLMFANQHTIFEPLPAVETCSAHIVQAQTGAPNFYPLTDDCDFMITSELSGCCMVLDRRTTPPQIAHVWPDKVAKQSGTKMQDELASGGLSLYGLKNYNTPYAYVIGVKANTWRFYAQERPLGGEIKAAKEIFI